MSSAYVQLVLTLSSIFNVAADAGVPAYYSARWVKAPEIKALYMTANSAGSAAKRGGIVDQVKKSELNAVVIDVKDYTGRVFFDSGVALAKYVKSENPKVMPDIKNFLKDLKKEKIYAIARVVVFQDPYLAERLPGIALKKKNGVIWRDKKGLAWVDPSSQWVWKYNVDIAKSAIRLGFDEINFDYIRFPSDGDIAQIQYPFDEKKISKSEVIANFFTYVGENLEGLPAYISIDVFGMTLWRTDGLNIGQRYQDAAGYVDFISPMVYPSHYPNNFQGYKNPAEYPYEIVYSSLIKSKDVLKDKRARIRPWLQSFNLGAIYDAGMVRKQIKASDDAGGYGWMIWNASNNYIPGAFLLK